jgi:hypothetical protein
MKSQDRATLAQQYGSVTVDDLFSQGWNGKLDAVVYPEGDAGAMRATLVKILPTSPIRLDSARQITIAGTYMFCDPGKLEELRTQLQGFK